MTPQERDFILGVAQRLRNATLTHKDNEAERLILTEIGSQKDALYLLTQAVIVQEQGLRHAQERIQQLEAAGSPQGHGGFLSNLFGGGSAPPPQPPAPAYPPQAGGGSGIGTFLGTAAAAAAGAVGGQLIYDGMRHLIGGPGSSGPQAGGGFLRGNPAPAYERTPAAPPTAPQDTDYSGAGGDFGGDASGNDSGGDFGGTEEEEDASDGGDFGDTDSADDDSQGGGDF